MKFHYLLGGCLLAATFSIYAQTAPVTQGEEVVVTATRIPVPSSESLYPVTVITASQIAEAGQQTLVELLRAHAGVEVTSNGGFGQTSAVRIRGAESRHTLVLLDGVRIDSATAGATALEHIPPSQIERIEIVSAPLSSLYGSDAVGGVIQIFTKAGRPRVPGVTASLGAGRYGTRQASGALNTAFGDTQLAIAAGLFESDGFSATKPTALFGVHHPDSDRYRNENFSGRLTHRIAPGHEAGMTVFWSESRTDFDSGPATDDRNRQDLGTFSLFSRNQVHAKWQSLLRGSASQDRSVITGAFPSTTRTDQHQLTWQNDVALPVGTLIAGTEYLEQKISGDTAYNRKNRNIQSLFVGYQGTFNSHGVQASLRQDDNSQFGGHGTGALAYGYHLTPRWQMVASAGTAFKAPTFNDLYFPTSCFFGFCFSGNPDLRPERSESYDFGLRFDGERQHWRATAFENRITDLIVAVFDPATLATTPQNVNKAKIQGLEISYQGTLAGWDAAGRMTLQDPVDTATDKQLRLRARRHGSLSLSHGFGAWRVGAELTASSARYDSSNQNPTTRMPGYGVVNLTAAWRLARNWSLAARWNNALDKDYELTQHNNTPGSNLFMSLQYQPE